jgi:hypothetical protein
MPIWSPVIPLQHEYADNILTVDLDVPQLRYFVTVADELSLTRAADYYHHAHLSYVALHDVAPRMVALARSAHRTMPELQEFAKIALDLLGRPNT